MPRSEWRKQTVLAIRNARKEAADCAKSVEDQKQQCHEWYTQQLAEHGRWLRYIEVLEGRIPKAAAEADKLEHELHMDDLSNAGDDDQLSSAGASADPDNMANARQGVQGPGAFHLGGALQGESAAGRPRPPSPPLGRGGGAPEIPGSPGGRRWQPAACTGLGRARRALEACWRP